MASNDIFGDLSATHRELARLETRIRDSVSNAELLDRRLQRTTTAGAGAGGGGRLPPTTAGAGAAPGGADDPRRGLEGRTRSTRGLSRATSYLVQQEVLASNALRKHGALTTEFINEAARGRTTIRELGTQVRDTTGKFGGWITAGAAVYGALGALTQIGEGAIEADRGVAEMSRTIDDLDVDTAKSDFRSLAEEFNLPVEEVAAAGAAMGKVFHQQNQALEATRAVLYGVRVGELDVATSSRYLTSIIQGFQLPAADMATVIDQINEAQNRFGADIPTTFAGIARAAGIAKAAGADFDSILALVTTGAKATGQSGNVVGTAIQRIPGQLRQPENQEFLRGLGIDPEAEMQEVIERAFQVAQTLSGEELQQLGSAIAGKQYGPRVFTPILQQYDLYKNVLRDTSAEAAAGGAQKELQTVLGATAEQAKQIVTQLEVLGSNLEQAGFVDPLKAGALTLREMLVLTNNLFELFNGLPEPLRKTLSYAVQLRLLLALMRRLQVGELVAGGPTGQPGPTRTAIAGFLQPQKGAGGYVAAGLDREGTFLEEQRARASTEAAQASQKADLAAIRSREQEAAGLQKQARTSAQASVVARERAENASLDEEATRRQLQANEAARREIRGRFGRVDSARAEAYARRTGAYVPLTYARPTTATPGQISEGGVVLPPGAEREMDKADRASADTQRRTSRFSRRFTNVTGRMATAGGLLARAGASIVGKLGIIAFGAFAFFTALNFLTDQADAIGDRLDKIRRGVSNQKQAEAKLNQLEGEVSAGASFSESLGNFLTLSGQFEPLGDAINFLGENVSVIPDVFGGLGQEGFDDERREAAEVQQRALEERSRQQREARDRGEPIPRRFVSDVAAEIPKIEQQSKTRSELRREIARLDEELAKSESGSLLIDPEKKEKELAKARQKLRDAQLTSAPDQDLFRSLLQVGDSGELTGLIEEQLGTLSLGFSPQELQRASDAFSAARARLATDRSPESIVAFQEARDAYFEGITNLVQDDLEGDLSLARSPRAKARAYDQARSRYRQAFGRTEERLDDQRARVARLREVIENRERSLSDQEDEINKPKRQSGDISAGKYQSRRQNLEKVRANLKRQEGVLGELTKAQRESQRELRLLLQEVAEKEFEEIQSLANARAEFRSSKTADPLAQARFQLESINRLLGRAIRVYGRNSEEVLSLLTERQSALSDITTENRDRLESRLNLSIARRFGPGQDLGQQRAEIQRDRRILDFMRANANRFDPTEILDLEATIIDAEQQLAEDVRERAIDARKGFLEIQAARAESRGNEVGALEAELKQDQIDLRNADSVADRRSARAGVIRRRAQLRDAQAQRRIENVEFEHELDRISDQQLISAYQRILRTQKLSIDTKKQLRLNIHRLRKESEEGGDFDLAVGDINLPTVYEIRRAVAGASPISSYQQNNVYMTINGADPQAVGREVYRMVGGRNRSARRSAGLVGS